MPGVAPERRRRPPACAPGLVPGCADPRAVRHGRGAVRRAGYLRAWARPRADEAAGIRAGGAPGERRRHPGTRERRREVPAGLLPGAESRDPGDVVGRVGGAARGGAAVPLVGRDARAGPPRGPRVVRRLPDRGRGPAVPVGRAGAVRGAPGCPRRSRPRSERAARSGPVAEPAGADGGACPRTDRGAHGARRGPLPGRGPADPPGGGNRRRRGG